jgi:hypothetical protein
MDKKFKYGTVSEAMNNLRQKGFDQDFSLEGNQLVSGNQRYDADELKVAVTYRYEGQSDPGDEATVYGIETDTGVKGILVIADGIYADVSTKILQKLHRAKNEGYQEGE